MGCFLACFGFKAKKKRRKPGKKSPSGEQDHQIYVPLHSDVSIKLDIKENMASDSYQLKEKPKEAAIAKIKKKVSFNLNVKAYEPIPDDDDDDDEEMGMYLSEETKWEFNIETKNMANLHYEEEDAIATSIWSYPASHRYQNCRDSCYDEEDDELKLEENEEIEDIDDDVYSNQDNDGMPSQEDYFPLELNLVAVKSDNEVINNNQIPEAKNTSSSLEHALDLQTKELQGLQSKSKAARDRSQYVFSVLNPVENLSQWKVVKAKVETPQLKCQKENSITSKQDGHNLSITKPYSESPASMKTGNPNFSQLAGPTIALQSMPVSQTG